jgi:photosystem II stability/assembly factor-like uncharacterized protein
MWRGTGRTHESQPRESQPRESQPRGSQPRGSQVSGSRVRTAACMALVAAALAAPPMMAAAAGGSWQAIGPSGGAVGALAIDPGSPDTIYAAGHSSGLFKSVDGGATWARSDAGLALGLPPGYGSLVITQVACAPGPGSTVYAVTALVVFKSVDGGATWSPTGALPPGILAGGLTIDPRAPETLYVAVGNRVWKSVDGAASWFDSGAGLPRRGSVGALAIDPARPATLYAGTPLGVFKSRDRGSTWRPARRRMGTLPVFALAVDPVVHTTVYAGVSAGNGALPSLFFVSSDGGASWTGKMLPHPNLGFQRIAVSPAAPRAVYALGAGLAKSADGGDSWIPLGAGLAASFSALAIDPVRPDQMYLGAGSVSAGPAVYKSADGGADWRPASAGIGTLEVSAMAVDPRQAGALYVGTSTDGLLASTDDGAHWTAANAGLHGVSIQALAIDPATPSTLYAETESGFFSTSNAAAQWSGGVFGGVPPLAVDPQHPGTVYTFQLFGAGEQLSRSVDGGATWTHLAGGLGYVNALAVAPSAPATLYLTQEAKIYHPFALVQASLDGGATFTWVSTFAGAPGAIAVDPSASTTLYIAKFRSDSPPFVEGVYGSTDGGHTLALLPGIGHTSSLLVDPGDPSVIYAGDADVLVSRDGGATWSQLAPGLPGATVRHLAFGPGRALYAGTQGGSVYRLAL